MMSDLKDKTIVLGVTGSIAAYKAVEVTRLLLKAGCKVRVIMTESAREFVGPATFAGLTGKPVLTGMWEDLVGEPHVELAKSADAFLLVPATADTMASLAQGRANSVLLAFALTFTGPSVIAPSMHPSMWSNKATQANANVLRERGVVMAGPVFGEVASGDHGLGRMLEPVAIVETLACALSPTPLKGMNVLISAGPTQEPLDPVRYLGNRSSGKMGYALAKIATRFGAKVSLVSGPVSLPHPYGVAVDAVSTAQEMQERMVYHAPNSDLIIMAAAVADFSPVFSANKLKKQAGINEMPINLLRTKDILAELSQHEGARAQVRVGFALETGTDDDLLLYAKGKLVSKKADLIVANRASDSLQHASNRIFLCGAAVEGPFEGSKDELAELILLRAKAIHERRAKDPGSVSP
jgi:phosphopantothenoylcysteine decarboxylase/phosphopantothenate--cysteine ligase